ncbi:MAG: sigma-70 family RNA polymerase sigma factor [Clostridia bacterium]|nr:sigma-70 family RNA polymerase sigma factor [Clostridia bacterium]
MNKINKKELHEIFENLRNKNQNAYNKLYENYYDLIYGIVFSFIKNKYDSEDLTHEIFTKIYKLDVSKLPTNNEASWLFTVSKNECFLHLRKAKPNISMNEIYEMPDNASGIDNVIDSEYYNNLMNGLKEDEKMIVSLKVLSDFTFKKISQVMNIPIGTVQWKYYNAINSLRISIGSLVGAVIAFAIVLARGEFWKEKPYLNDRENREYDKNTEINQDTEVNQESAENKEIDDVDLKDNSKSENIENNSSNIETNEATNSEKEEKPQDNSEISNDTSTVTSYNEPVISANKKTSIDEVQAVLIVVGIVLFTIFIIFFKKYQQKLKKKSSK